ncbi:MAG TPA: non-homologous end-joining DNA ligase [Blastocatellia bacterium]|nr:non-homologous end-joining DNA ligase [Blastocatellia bacterium]
MAQKQINNIPGARKASMPGFVAPQLATLVDDPPLGDDWIHEIKFDGYRMLCHLDHGKVSFFSRNQKDWTSKFPGIAKAINSLEATTAIIDGEVVIMDKGGRTSFQRLQQAMGRGGPGGFIYQAFDLIYLDGFDLSRSPLIERKEQLKKLIATGPKSSVLHYSDHHGGSGELFFKRACEYDLEGIVSKRADSQYVSARNRNWLKVKCGKRQEFVIAGYIPSDKGLPGFGSLILGVYEKGKLIYAGRVGTGFTMKQRAELGKKLDRIARATMPFAIKPDAKGLNEAHWCEPKLVAEVAFTEWTSDGSIRHPSFQSLREDKKPEDVRRELPAD